MLNKAKKALEIVNDAYEMGDNTREEWLERKKKRESEINSLQSEIYALKKQVQDNKKMTNFERQNNLEAFFDSIQTCICSSEQNTLYKTIIDSIMWQRDGDNVEVKINYL